MSGKKTKQDLLKVLMRSEIKAKDIAQALAEEKSELARIVLRRKRITGKLDLKYRVISVPLTFRQCEFLGEVDLRNCKFEQVVDFTGSTFYQRFKGGDEAESHTIYTKDLICNDVTFEADVSFMGSRFESSASFSSTTFQGREETINFSATSFEKFLYCNGAIFRNSVDFRGLKCGKVGHFHPATAEVDGEQNSLRLVTFEKEANFRFASFGINLQFDKATFKDRADFGFLKCGDNAIFRLCVFESEWQAADFTRASFGESLECFGATFKGPASFNGIKCGAHGLFGPVELEGGEGNGNRPVTFEKTADFRFASFEQNLECQEAKFKGSANFVAVKCGAYAHFSSAEFGDQEDDEEEGEEEDEEVTTFERATIEGVLVCSGTKFKGPVVFYNATLGILALTDDFQFAPETLDLRALTFKRFDGTPDEAKRFVEAQDPTLFSRDPYLQLEQYYRSIGKDAQAREFYYQGHLALRENATKQNGGAEWSRVTNVVDWLWKTLTHYGVQTRRLLAIALGFVIVGTLVFYLPDIYLSVDTLKLASDSAKTFSWEQGWLYRAAYSLDLFLPLVNLHIDEKWVPNTPFLQAYAVVHTMVGWLIVPLLIAALAGIIRR
jgi:hypothetical protein